MRTARRSAQRGGGVGRKRLCPWEGARGALPKQLAEARRLARVQSMRSVNRVLTEDPRAPRKPRTGEERLVIIAD